MASNPISWIITEIAFICILCLLFEGTRSTRSRKKTLIPSSNSTTHFQSFQQRSERNRSFWSQQKFCPAAPGVMNYRFVPQQGLPWRILDALNLKQLVLAVSRPAIKQIKGEHVWKLGEDFWLMGWKPFKHPVVSIFTPLKINTASIGPNREWKSTQTARTKKVKRTLVRSAMTSPFVVCTIGAIQLSELLVIVHISGVAISSCSLVPTGFIGTFLVGFVHSNMSIGQHLGTQDPLMDSLCSIANCFHKLCWFNLKLLVGSSFTRVLVTSYISMFAWFSSWILVDLGCSAQDFHIVMDLSLLQGGAPPL